MIRSFTITNYLGDSIFLDIRRPEKSGFLIKSVTGLGPSKANINTTEIATNDGSYYNSARIAQRNIVFSLVFMMTESGEDIETVRQKTYRYFPLKKEVMIAIETDNRILTTVGYTESNEPDIFSSSEGAQISIVCPDPYFYSNRISKTTFYGVDALFEFPFSNEDLVNPLLIFGNIQTKRENNVYYEGDSEIGVIITIKASAIAKNITIYNAATREIMKIDTSKLPSPSSGDSGGSSGSGDNKEDNKSDGHNKSDGSGSTPVSTPSMIRGDEIVINTMKGEKSIVLIREGIATNILNSLSKDSDWFTLSKGDNVFAFTAEEGLDSLQFYIENYIVYEGA